MNYRQGKRGRCGLLAVSVGTVRAHLVAGTEHLGDTSCEMVHHITHILTFASCTRQKEKVVRKKHEANLRTDCAGSCPWKVFVLYMSLHLKRTL